MYCLECKDYTHNFKPQEVKMTNKVLREKSNCVVCRSSKSRFLKQKQQQKVIQRQNKFSNPIKSRNNFYRLQNMKIYCKNCKKHTRNTFPKKLVFISKKKIKIKSKCAICLTERTFIDKIEDEYDLESELEVYLQFFTD